MPPEELAASLEQGREQKPGAVVAQIVRLGASIC
jgi:hypothetical protein